MKMIELQSERFCNIKAEYMSTDKTQLNSTQLNWTKSKHVLEISLIHVCKTQLNSTQRNTTQLNSTGVFRHVLDLKLNSTQLN
jgi:hypothetical protein